MFMQHTLKCTAGRVPWHEITQVKEKLLHHLHLAKVTICPSLFLLHLISLLSFTSEPSLLPLCSQAQRWSQLFT